MYDYIIDRALNQVRSIFPNMTKKELKALFKILLSATRQELLAEGRVKIPGFGVLSFEHAKGFNSRDLQGKLRKIPNRVKLRFKPVNRLKLIAKTYIMPSLFDGEFGETNMMEKNAVLGNKELTKTAEKSDKTLCPKCAKECDTDGSLPRCPNHGTAPFESKEV